MTVTRTAFHGSRDALPGSKNPLPHSSDTHSGSALPQVCERQDGADVAAHRRGPRRVPVGRRRVACLAAGLTGLGGAGRQEAYRSTAVPRNALGGGTVSGPSSFRTSGRGLRPVSKPPHAVSVNSRARAVAAIMLETCSGGEVATVNPGESRAYGGCGDDVELSIAASLGVFCLVASSIAPSGRTITAPKRKPISTPTTQCSHA